MVNGKLQSLIYWKKTVSHCNCKKTYFRPNFNLKWPLQCQVDDLHRLNLCHLCLLTQCAATSTHWLLIKTPLHTNPLESNIDACQCATSVSRDEPRLTPHSLFSTNTPTISKKFLAHVQWEKPQQIETIDKNVTQIAASRARNRKKRLGKKIAIYN